MWFSPTVYHGTVLHQIYCCIVLLILITACDSPLFALVSIHIQIVQCLVIQELICIVPSGGSYVFRAER